MLHSLTLRSSEPLRTLSDWQSNARTLETWPWCQRFVSSTWNKENFLSRTNYFFVCFCPFWPPNKYILKPKLAYFSLLYKSTFSCGLYTYFVHKNMKNPPSKVRNFSKIAEVFITANNGQVCSHNVILEYFIIKE